MKANLFLTCAMVTAMTLGACGNLSNEDLLFLSGRPTRDDVEVAPPGTTTDGSSNTTQQALGLVCDDGDLRCHAQNIAQLLNGLTFALLDLADAITNEEPTVRSPGYRRWGPFTTGDGVLATFVFQMTRDGDELVFCLHGVSGEDPRSGDADARVPSCADDGGTADEPLQRLWFGNVTKSQDSSLRNSSGTMTLYGDAVATINRERSLGRVLDFAFSSQDDRSNVRIAVVDGLFDDTDERAPSQYEYSKEADGAGTFAFVTQRNIVQDGLRRRAESLSLRAAWDSTQAGRGDAEVFGGDLNEPVSWAQCWSAAPGFDVVFQSTTEGTIGTDSDCTILEGIE
jgi:hypothetical protein